MDNKDNGIKERVTIYVVAQAANVSLATVSRVINKKKNVTEKTRKAVEDTIKRLGYKPSALAQGLATSHSTNLGILMPSNSYVYTSNMLSGMVDVAKIYGYQTSLFVTRKTKEDASKVIEKLISSHVDGAVIYDDELSADEIMMIQNYKIPLVIIGHEMKGNELASILLDYKTQLISCLSKNFSNEKGGDVVFLQAEGEGFMMDDLKESVAAFCKEKGKIFSILPCTDSYTRLYQTMPEWFKENGSKGHLFIAPRDSLAAAICNICVDNGIKIPGDIQVLSVIGTKYSYICRPEISSLDIDMFMVGATAVRMLTKLLQDKLSEEEKVFRISASYSKRQSTKD